ncbi:hypothetical protein FB566_2582 [Stackebrandtia endophytica]|uniref:Uncharacterized protein n=1 Tax=Stackebrandtia endophytica TaxID=1496996 RepID=A0A543AWT2_9ACTN|nr:hypothetical protein [Stackebrandtia endophytica]TQL77038.1 hypothetical protein FB566_2582 [Stackebrandtia endophytica]
MSPVETASLLGTIAVCLLPMVRVMYLIIRRRLSQVLALLGGGFVTYMYVGAAVGSWTVLPEASMVFGAVAVVINTVIAVIGITAFVVLSQRWVTLWTLPPAPPSAWRPPNSPPHPWPRALGPRSPR